MTGPRTMIFAMAALAMAGCSSTDTARPAATAGASHPAPPSPTRTAASAFCLDLSTFQVAVIMYRSEAGKAIDGKPLDFKDLRERAAMIAQYGAEMRGSAPPDIAARFRTVLTAVKGSASRLKTGSSVRDVVDPLYGARNRPAFDAVDRYHCR
jgi:hypothetical protein